MNNQKNAVRPKFPTSLKKWKYEIERIGRKYGLDFYPNMIIMADHEEISELAAFSGYPVRYHHWKFGQESLRMKKSYRWGLHIIYEMVVPTKPCYSYFLDANPEVIQKAVIAHACIGHNDFFKNNVWFQDIPTNLHHRFGDNANRVDELRLEIGKEKVDKFLEACLSLDNIFDLLQPLILHELPKSKGQKDKKSPKRIFTRDKLPYYMEPYVNPPEYLEAERKRIEADKKRISDIERKVVIPAKPLRDVLDFFLNNAPLEGWQQEIVRIVREESLALMKGGQTKIMNEGWAAFWEATIMAGEGVAVDAELCSFAKSFAGVQRATKFSINPYKLGNEIWNDIKFRWDTGRHGAIYDECDINVVKERWDEFIVFKSLFDECNGDVIAITAVWNEFKWFVKETKEDRGFIRPAFFTPEVMILEWLKYSRAGKKLPDLLNTLGELKKSGDAFVPESSLSKYRFWTSEELSQEISHCEFYERMHKLFVDQIRGRHASTNVPKEWKDWARRHEFLGSLGQGLEKMFEVRSSHNDINFIQDFFNQDFCDKYAYYTFGVGNPEEYWGEERILIKSRNFLRVKRKLIEMCLNLGQPKMVLLDANFNNNSEIRLIHLHDGRDLCYSGCPNCGGVSPGVKEVLERLYVVWNKEKPIHIETIKTSWPKKRRPWDYWRPPGYPKPEIQKPKYAWMRYSFNGIRHDYHELEFEKIPDVETIKKILPKIPDKI